MKILFDPREQPWTKHIVCWECKAEFEITLEDINCKMTVEDYGEYWKVDAVECPVCRTKIQVSPPSWWRKKRKG